MANFEQFNREVHEALQIFPMSVTMATNRFRQAFADIPDYQMKAILSQMTELLQTVGQNLVKYGQTAIYDYEIEAIVIDDTDIYGQSEDLVAFRRGALRDFIAYQLKGRGYVVTRKKSDGRPRIVVSLI